MYEYSVFIFFSFVFKLSIQFVISLKNIFIEYTHLLFVSNQLFRLIKLCKLILEKNC